MGTPEVPQPIETMEERTARRAREAQELDGEYARGVQRVKDQVQRFFPECEWRGGSLFFNRTHLRAISGLTDEQMTRSVFGNLVASIEREGSAPKLCVRTGSATTNRMRTFRIRMDGTINLGLVRTAITVIQADMERIASRLKQDIERRDQKERQLQARLPGIKELLDAYEATHPPQREVNGTIVRRTLPSFNEFVKYWEPLRSPTPPLTLRGLTVEQLRTVITLVMSDPSTDQVVTDEEN